MKKILIASLTPKNRADLLSILVLVKVNLVQAEMRQSFDKVLAMLTGERGDVSLWFFIFWHTEAKKCNEFLEDICRFEFIL